MTGPSSAPVAAVTGGTGFIGWRLCERLRDAGWTVSAMVRPSSSNPLPEGVERHDAALDAEAMRPACEGAQVVYHLAGLTRAPTLAQFERVNAAGARQAAIAAQRAGAFFVLVSSQAAAGPGTPQHVRHESDKPEPVSDYGRSKLAGERAVQTVDGLRFAIVRPPGVYGPRDRDFLTLFLAARRGLVPRLGSAAKAYTLIHVDDAVEALDALATAGIEGNPAVQGETFFIGHPRPVTQGDLLAHLAAQFGRRPRQIPVPIPLLRLLAEFGELKGRVTGRPAVLNRSRFDELAAPGFVCSVDKVAAAVGWRARLALDVGLRQTAQWYREAGWL